MPIAHLQFFCNVTKTSLKHHMHLRARLYEGLHECSNNDLTQWLAKLKCIMFACNLTRLRRHFSSVNTLNSYKQCVNTSHVRTQLWTLTETQTKEAPYTLYTYAIQICSAEHQSVSCDLTTYSGALTMY